MKDQKSKPKTFDEMLDEAFLNIIVGKLRDARERCLANVRRIEERKKERLA